MPFNFNVFCVRVCARKNKSAKIARYVWGDGPSYENSGVYNVFLF